jgi:glutathione S-transferase
MPRIGSLDGMSWHAEALRAAAAEDRPSWPMKLVYFNVRGVVEVSRYMLHMAGAEYEDRRYPFDNSNWAKPDAYAAKMEGKHDIDMDRLPFGRLPFIEVDGQLLEQSKAIERFVANRFGFYGANDMEAAQIDCICEHVRDIKDAYQKVRGIQDDWEKKASMEKWFGTDLPEWLEKLEKVWQIWCARAAKLSAAELVNKHASTTLTLCVRMPTHITSVCARAGFGSSARTCARCVLSKR